MAEELLRSESIPSIFWGLMTLIATLSMLYLTIWGHIYDVEEAFNVGTITLGILFVAMVLTAGEILYAETNILESSQAFLVGLVFWFVFALNSEANVISAVAQLEIYELSGVSETAGGEFWEVFVPTIINPIVEEMLWAVGLPVFLILLMHGLAQSSRGVRSPFVAKTLKAFDSPVVQLGVLLIVLPLTFAYFHIGQQASMLFIMSAIIFRAILTVLWWGDLQWNLVPFLIILPSFLVGSHMGNNAGVVAREMGIMAFLTVFFSHPIGWMTGAVIGFLILLAILGIIEDVKILQKLFS